MVECRECCGTEYGTSHANTCIEKKKLKAMEGMNEILEQLRKELRRSRK